MSAVYEKENKKLLERTKRSEEIYKLSAEVTPFGVHSNYRAMDPYPIYFTRGKGSKLWDADGNKYIDFHMAFGVLVAGHSHPVLVEAMKDRIANGTILGFEFDDSYKLAKLICERFGVDMVKFSTTGGEATNYAVRFARAYTERKKILKFEGCYHGFPDSFLVNVKPTVAKAGHPRFPNQVPASKGILEEAVKQTLIAPFNDLEAVETLMKKHGNEVAAIILEPVPMNMGYILPKSGFLEGLRKIANEYNSVLIFDEVKTSGKFYRGAADYFKVKPDLVTMAKAIAGGYPLSLVAGKKDIMNSVVPGVISHAGTFNSNSLVITAGLVTLSKILTEKAMNNATKLSGMLAKGYQEIIKDAKIDALVKWAGTSGTVHFTKAKKIENWRDFVNTIDIARWFLYTVIMLNRGIVPSALGPDEQWTISVQHTKEDIEKHLEVFKEIAGHVRKLDLEMPMVEAI
ncbi:MAG: aspartate aminotransferase family protein [Candidatus Bathyarchaeota archaeon]|nr:aspartate aminotransferase family protein [Candidatus Bathyarchaeota archaeon]MDH5713541.1 aspartate aminotransferase family protein [Candidatus Bathyarchaeota archaeon]